MKNAIIENLKSEINDTLLFFVESDLKIYGFITKGTIEAFETQNVKLPDSLNELIHQEKPLSEIGQTVINALAYATDCQQPYFHPNFKKLVYSDNIKLLCTKAQSYWLLDIIGSVLPQIQQHDFSVIKLDVYRLGNGQTKALFTCDDGDDKVYYRQTIEFTDFPIDEISFYYENDLLYLPSER